MIPVKICGITSQKNARLAVNYGASAIGIIFYDKSPRYVHPQQATEWIKKVSGKVKKVGVFVDEQIEVIQSIANELGLDYIQLHGDEQPEYCAEIITPVIKVIRVDNHVDNSVLEGYDVHAFLLDTFKKGIPGGTGEQFDWDLISDLETDTPIILSGGLRPDNIIRGIERIKPAAVDVNSGVEVSVGEKDESKMRQLFEVLKNTDNHFNLFNNTIVERNDEL